jgi:hypothetical protein
MRRRCFRAKRRREAAATPPSANGQAVTASTQVPTLAGVMLEEGEDMPTRAPPRNATPLIEKWPEGYERGSFRLVPGAALLSAAGRPTLRIEEGEQLSI